MIALLMCSFLFSAHIIIEADANLMGYRRWSPANSSWTHMYCPEECSTDPGEDDCCCCCDSLPCWDIKPAACNVTVDKLYIEYINNFGGAVLIAPTDASEAVVYEANHRNGRLSKLPGNLCDFSESIVKIDFSYNRIEEIREIACLQKLDTLILDSNRLTRLDNDTFADMQYLRVVSLSRNNIVTLDPNASRTKHGNIMMIDFSYNIMETMDVTNFIRVGPFCEFKCEGCEMKEQTNLLNFKFSENIKHGPGSVLLYNTSFLHHFFNFTEIGLDDYSKIKLVFKGTIDYSDGAISCDCNIYPLLFTLGPDASQYWPSVQNTTCSSPERMRGRNLSEISLFKQFDDLTCDLPYCPRDCVCTDRPSKDAVEVKCINQASLPEFMPIGYWNNHNIDLDLSHPSNKVTEVANRNYMQRIVSLNLSGNAIDNIENTAVQHLVKNTELDIGLAPHKVNILPASFKKLNPRQISFSGGIVLCNCDNLWIGDWIRFNLAHEKLLCSTPKGVYFAEYVTREFLDCYRAEAGFPIAAVYAVALIVLLVILLAATIYYFRYEILVLKRKYFKRNLNQYEADFDVFLSFAEDNSQVFKWMETWVYPALRSEGYTVYVPFYNLLFTQDRDSQIAENVSKSKNYVIVLCHEYLRVQQSLEEFETIWKHFRMDESKHIIVVNFDSLESSEITMQRLRAFVRIRDDLNFQNRNSKMFERLKSRLGPVPKKNERRKNGSDDEETMSSDSELSEREEEISVDIHGQDELTNKHTTSQRESKNKENELAGDKYQGMQNKDLGKYEGKITRKRRSWYNRLHARKTTCNCRYRKCYLHAEDAYNAEASIEHAKSANVQPASSVEINRTPKISPKLDESVA